MTLRSTAIVPLRSEFMTPRISSSGSMNAIVRNWIIFMASRLLAYDQAGDPAEPAAIYASRRYLSKTRRNTAFNFCWNLSGNAGKIKYV
jgi:hypothetical protein